MSAQYQVSGDSVASISASIERGVRLGDWVSGAALPAIRILALDLHVSPATVAKAYQQLKLRGLVETDGRRGTRIRSRPAIADSRMALRLPVPPGVLDLSAGEPDLRLLPALGPSLRAICSSVDWPLGYASAAAMPELIDAARPRLAADGVPVEHAAITVTSGALDALERLLTTQLRPGDAVAVEDPGWTGLFDLVAALGLRRLPVILDEQGPVPASLAAALHAGAQAVVLTVRAQNPTGAAVSASRAAELRAVFADHRDPVLLIEDDHAAELAQVALECIGPITTAWAFVRSASKSFGPDLRVAVLAGDETTIARVVGRMRIGAGWVSTVLQRLLLQLWQDDTVMAGISAAARDYEQRRTLLRDALAARDVPATGATGINIWVPVIDETRTVGLLRDAGYAVAPGSLFRLASPPGIRLTISPLARADLPALADAVAAAVHAPGSTSASR